MMFKSLLLVSGLASMATASGFCDASASLGQQYADVLTNIQAVQANASSPNAVDKVLSKSALSSNLLPRVHGLENNINALKTNSGLPGSASGLLNNITASLNNLGSSIDQTVPGIASSAIAGAVPSGTPAPIAGSTPAALKRLSNAVAASKSRVDALQSKTCSQTQKAKRDDLDDWLQGLLDEINSLINAIEEEVDSIISWVDSYVNEVIGEVTDLIQNIEDAIEEGVNGSSSSN